MDGKTKGLIVGENFVIEEEEIVAAEFDEPLGGEVTIYLRGGSKLSLNHMTNEGPHAIYLRVRAFLEKNAAAKIARREHMQSLFVESSPGGKLRRATALTMRRDRCTTIEPGLLLLDGELEQTQIIDEVHFLLERTDVDPIVELRRRRARWERKPFVTPNGDEVWQWRYRKTDTKVPNSVDETWRSQCVIHNVKIDGGETERVRVRWKNYWLHPFENKWEREPAAVTMPTFANLALAQNVLAEAPAPPGFVSHWGGQVDRVSLGLVREAGTSAVSVAASSWRSRCTLGSQPLNTNGNDLCTWVRWCEPATGIYYWLDPRTRQWTTDGDKYNCVMFANADDAKSALESAPNPPGAIVR